MAKTIEKVHAQLKPESAQLKVLKQAISEPNTRLKKIFSHTPEKIVVVPIGDIIRCNSDNNYTIFYFKDKKMLVSKTLKFYPNLLKELGFLRVHQSHLVVTKFIK